MLTLVAKSLVVDYTAAHIVLWWSRRWTGEVCFWGSGTRRLVSRGLEDGVRILNHLLQAIEAGFIAGGGVLLHSYRHG